MTTKLLSAKYIAECIIAIADEGENSDMTNLKLQKLLYYAQGTSLVTLNKRLFKEDLYKWQYGPVVPEVYHYFKKFGDQIISLENNVDLSKLGNEQREILHDVYDFFGQFSAIRLMHFTHSEPPWNNANLNEVIPEDALKSFFKDIVTID